MRPQLDTFFSKDRSRAVKRSCWAVFIVLLTVIMPVKAKGLLKYSVLALPRHDLSYKPFGTNIIKLSPALFGPKIKGVNLAFETGFFSRLLSTCLTARYFGGVDSLETGRSDIGRNVRFELQLRIWPLNNLDGLFLAPLGDVYSNGGLAGGFVVGYQFFITKFLVAEAFGGFQTTSKAENNYYESPILPRIGIYFGFSWTKNIENEN